MSSLLRYWCRSFFCFRKVMRRDMRRERCFGGSPCLGELFTCICSIDVCDGFVVVVCWMSKCLLIVVCGGWMKVVVDDFLGSCWGYRS